MTAPTQSVPMRRTITTVRAREPPPSRPLCLSFLLTQRGGAPRVPRRSRVPEGTWRAYRLFISPARLPSPEECVPDLGASIGSVGGTPALPARAARGTPISQHAEPPGDRKVSAIASVSPQGQMVIAPTLWRCSAATRRRVPPAAPPRGHRPGYPSTVDAAGGHPPTGPPASSSGLGRMDMQSTQDWSLAASVRGPSLEERLEVAATTKRPAADPNPRRVAFVCGGGATWCPSVSPPWPGGHHPTLARLLAP